MWNAVAMALKPYGLHPVCGVLPALLSFGAATLWAISTVDWANAAPILVPSEVLRRSLQAGFQPELWLPPLIDQVRAWQLDLPWPAVGLRPLQVIVDLYLGALLFIWGFAAPLCSVWRARQLPKALGSHGTAAWGTQAEAQAAGFVHDPSADSKLLLGAYAADWRGHRAHFQVDTHVLTCAPTGAGKGIGAVLYNLLTYPGSIFVLDLKGENYAVTAKARRGLKNRVARLDPFGLCDPDKPSHAINWLQHIDPKSPQGVSEATMLAESLIVPTSHHDSHWDDSASYLLQGLILFVAAGEKQQCSMATVRELLTQGDAKLKATLQKMDAAATKSDALQPMARVARTFLAKEDRERSAVLSTAVRHTRFLDDPRLTATLQHSDFSFRDLKKENITVYLTIPPDKLAACVGYIRGLLALALQDMVTETTQPKHSVVFLLDEVAQLRRMKCVEDAISILRGYHVRLWLFFQDLSQLRAHYRSWETFIANCTLQFFGTQDYGTAAYISDLLGKQTLCVTNHGQHIGDGRNRNSDSRNETHIARPLLTPDEVCVLPPTQVIVRAASQRPQKLQRLNYLQEPKLFKDAAPNPMVKRSTIEPAQVSA
jgi:type IV secretory pathway TraG/TraD family ATPase VirD4